MTSTADYLADLHRNALARQERLRHPTSNDMKLANQSLIDRAKRDVDLAAFLGGQGGWTTAANDTARWRFLNGPNGQRVLIHRAQSGEWVWQDAQDRAVRGNIYHACTRLLNLLPGKAWAAIRSAVATPPPVLPIGRGTRTPTAPATPCQPRPPRYLPRLTDRGRRYLTEVRHLDAATIDAFAHMLKETVRGAVVAIHNKAHDGEEKGEGVTRFTGAADDGPGRGRSLWLATPHHQGVPEQIIVCDSFIDAMSAWEVLDDRLKPTVAVVSTGGSVSQAGRDRLARALARMVEAHGEHITPILIDGSDTGEGSTAGREQWLTDLAAATGVEYRRSAPTKGKDWNETLVAEKRAQDITRVEAYILPPDEAGIAQEGRQGEECGI